jgi:hypothetical protein
LEPDSYPPIHTQKVIIYRSPKGLILISHMLIHGPAECSEEVKAK